MKCLAVFLCLIAVTSCAHRQPRLVPGSVPSPHWQTEKPLSTMNHEVVYRTAYQNFRFYVSFDSGSQRQRILIYCDQVGQDSLTECLSYELTNGQVVGWYYQKLARVKVSVNHTIESHLEAIEAKWKHSDLKLLLTEPFLRTIPNPKIVELAIKAKLYADNQ